MLSGEKTMFFDIQGKNIQAFKAEEERVLIFNTKDAVISRIVHDIVSGENSLKRSLYHSRNRELVVHTVFSI